MIIPGALYMIPTEIAADTTAAVLPPRIREAVEGINAFAVEDLRSARRFIKRVVPAKVIDGVQFFEIGKHGEQKEDPTAIISLLRQGEAVGVLSEAGCPGVADPGSVVAAAAQRAGIRVVPLVGPSSLLLALMASGLNGQCFAFKGYLPTRKPELKEHLRTMEERIHRLAEAQIFIETPFRNNQLLGEVVRSCKGSTLLCIAQDISGAGEYIHTHPVEYWRTHLPQLAKLPTVFILGC